MSRGKRVRIGTGVYRDAIGISATVKVNGRQRERRFKADTAPETIVTWQRRMRAKIELGQDAPETAGPTLREDIDAYTALFPKGRGKDDVTMLLGHWQATAHADAPRSALTAGDVAAQMLAWHRDGAAAQTVNHRRRALVGLYKTLGGPQGPNPARDAAKLRTPRRAPRGLPWPVVVAILSHLDTRAGYDKSKARLYVMATTGWPHAVIARLERRDLHLAGPTPHVIILARQKGAGVPTKALPITPDAVKALKAFVAAKAFGPFSRSSLYKTFKRAAKKAGAPTDARPYDLRHTMAVRLYAATRDLRAVKELMIHASLSTTAQYAEQAVTATAQAAIDTFAGTAAGTIGDQGKSRKKTRGATAF
jgi:integrase